jgi:hypothetical protein
MNDKLRKRTAMVILTLSLFGGTLLAAGTTSFESAWGEGNNQPQSGVFLAGKDRFVAAGSNETHTGGLTALLGR